MQEKICFVFSKHTKLDIKNLCCNTEFKKVEIIKIDYNVNMLKAKSEFNPEISQNKKIRFFVFDQQFSRYQQLLTHLKIYITTYFE